MSYFDSSFRDNYPSISNIFNLDSSRDFYLRQFSYCYSLACYWFYFHNRTFVDNTLSINTIK